MTNAVRGDEPLFTWSDGRAVLIAERTPAGVTLSRGWRVHDELNDVRRWQFAEAVPFGGQIRRLVRDATGSDATGATVAAEALAWFGSADRRDDGTAPEPEAETKRPP